jgi:hypothetical protein
MLPQMPLRIGISIAFLILFVLHREWPEVAKDPVTLALLAFALLPWLQPLLKTVKLPGGIEKTLLDLKQEIKATTGAAESAKRKAELAVSGIWASHATMTPTAIDSAQPTKPKLEVLTEEYDHIRATQKSGPARTSAMNAVIREMIEHARDIPDQILVQLLKAAKSGERLIAYASLFGNPRHGLLAELTASVASRESQPFGQYWGPQAVGKNLPAASQELPDAVLSTLAALASTLKPQTDGHSELSRILRQVRGK